MTHQEIRRKFLDFFKARGHVVVPSSSLLPTDPSVLFTTAGMQQFKPYYTGEADPIKDFGTLNAASIQKSIRTSDIDEVGDESHLTFFEMLGNFSFGYVEGSRPAGGPSGAGDGHKRPGISVGYFKKEAIEWAYEFVTAEMGLKVDYVSVFGGHEEVPADQESEVIWKQIDPEIEIKKFGKTDNFWGPTGSHGPCGPTTEIYVSGVEIWNLVFNEYYCRPSGQLEPLKTSGVDTGMGLERLAMVVQKKNDIFETDLFEPLMELLPPDLDLRRKRIVADHARAAAFIIADGVRPSNKEQGYVLRRLLRRIIVHAHLANFDETGLGDVFEKIVTQYCQFYPELDQKIITAVADLENKKFQKTLRQGLAQLNRLGAVDDQSAFRLYESFGLPYEIIKEIGGRGAQGLTRQGFEAEFKKHQAKSRAGSTRKFGGHGLILDTGELKAADEEELKIVTRLHTATHLLQAALRKILGDDVRQDGSDITAERLRFDFTFPRKLTGDEIKLVEDLVNEVIRQDLQVTKEEMSYDDAVKTGALSFFKLKYPPRVNVYSVGGFSKELCGGPHVSRTGEIGEFKITKEEAVSAGVRRIRAMVMTYMGAM